MLKKISANYPLIQKILLGVIFSFLVLLSFRTLQSQMFNIHFVDEDENLVAGYYLAQGQKLYADIFSHKQPMPAVFSALVNKIFKPNSLFLFIKRHREAVFGYSVLWWLVFLSEFGFTGLIFSLAIELSKRFLLGDLFLGESLVIYPLAFVLGYLWHHQWEKLEFRGLRRYLFFFSLILIPFQLIILIPFSVMVVGYLLFKEKDKKRLGGELFLILAIITLVFLPFVSYPDYLLNTQAALSAHYLEDTVNQGFWLLFRYSFLKPLVALTTSVKGEFGLLVRVLSGLYLSSFIYLFFKEKKQRAFLLFSFLLLGATSLRLTFPQAVLYEGFHGFPWLAGLIFLITIQLRQAIFLNWLTFKRKVAVIISLALSVLLLFSSGQFLLQDYFRRADRERDFFVNFSRFEGTGTVIKNLSASGDRLMVIPVEQLLYFVSGLPSQNRFLYTYEWIFWNEELKNEIKTNLENSPPAFVYYDYASVGNDAKSIFDPVVADYIQLRHGNDASFLLMRKDKIESLRSDQIEAIKKFDFSLPEIE